METTSRRTNLNTYNFVLSASYHFEVSLKCLEFISGDYQL